MTEEELHDEIKLIFARACAGAMKDHAVEILRIQNDEDRSAKVSNIGEAFALAFSIVHDDFMKVRESASSRPSTASAHTAPSSSNHEAALQAGAAQFCPAPDGSPGCTPNPQESDR